MLCWWIKIWIYLSPCVLCLQAQHQDLMTCYDLRYTELLPKDILSTRVACMVDPGSEDILGWRAVAQEAQHYFQKLGLDVVWYASAADIHMGEEVAAAYGDRIRRRTVRYLVFLHLRKATDSLKVNFVIAPVAKTHGLIEAGAVGWQHSTQSLKQLYTYLLQKSSAQNIVQSNWLINETAEYMPAISLPTRRRLKELPMHMRKHKLAVVARCLSCQRGALSCQALIKDNQQLAHWFSTQYEGTYKIIPRGDAIPLGYEHILYILHGVRPAVDTILKERPRKYGPQEATEKVYAFYIKHLFTEILYSLSHRGTTLAEALAPLKSKRE